MCKCTCSRVLCRADAVDVYVYMRLYKELADWDYLSTIKMVILFCGSFQQAAGIERIFTVNMIMNVQ